jgi:hypothetical protein
LRVESRDLWIFVFNLLLSIKENEFHLKLSPSEPTRPPGKQTKQGPKNGSGDIEYLQRMVKKLSNEIIDMKRSAGKVTKARGPINIFSKEIHCSKRLNLPPSNLNIDLGNIAVDSFCTYHQEKQSKIDCPQWVYAMILMANQFLDEVYLTEQTSGSFMNIVDQEEVDPPEKQPC